MNKLLAGVYIFIGPPGSGKGSLSQQCSAELGIKQLSTGNLCRWHVDRGTEIGKEIDLAIKSGKLVSDCLVMRMVDGWLTDQASSGGQKVIFDGYPRTVSQAYTLDWFLKCRFSSCQPCVVRFTIPDERVVARLTKRYVCSNRMCQAVYSLLPGSPFAPKRGMQCDSCGQAIVRRADDEEASVVERLKVYHDHEQALLGACRDIGWPVHDVDVAGSWDDVVDAFKRIAERGD